MKPTAMLGLVLVVLGVAALAYQGFTYTTRDTVLDVGPLHATTEHQNNVALPPIIGGAVVIGGVALLIVGMRKRS